MNKQKEREQEINCAVKLIMGILNQYNLTLTADLEREHLVIVDETTDKRYGILLEDE